MPDSELSRRIIRAKRVKELTGLAHQIYAKSKDPDDDFPAFVRIGPSAVGWYEDEILAWRGARPRSKPVLVAENAA